MEPDVEFIPLESVIGFEDFNFDMFYIEKEIEILQPRLEKLGYTDVRWRDGAIASNGVPITRVCVAKDKKRHTVHFVYG